MILSRSLKESGRPILQAVAHPTIIRTTAANISAKGCARDGRNEKMSKFMRDITRKIRHAASSHLKTIVVHDNEKHWALRQTPYVPGSAKFAHSEATITPGSPQEGMKATAST